LIKEDLEKFKAQNKRAQALQAEKRAQNEEFNEKLGELEKAELLLKGSVTGIEDIKKQEEDMLREREAHTHTHKHIHTHICTHTHTYIHT
jgi:predicted phage gp36 major capsid-like protein